MVHLPSTRSLELHVQTSYLLWLSLPSSLKHQGSWLALLVEVLVLGLPLLAVLTVASEHAAFLNVAQIVSAAASRQFFNSESHETPPSPGAPHRRKSHHFGAPNMSSEHSRTPRSTTSRRKNSGTAKLDTSSQQQRKRPSFSRPFVTVRAYYSLSHQL